MRLLLVVNDLLVYESAISQPTGIQRVASGLVRAVVAGEGPSAITVSLSGDETREVRLRRGGASPLARLSEPLLRLLALAPRAVQESIRKAARYALARVAAMRGSPITVESGDWIVILGAPWIAPGTAGSALRIVAARSARLAVLVHDLLPASSPEWFADTQGRGAHDDMARLIAAADRLFAVSPEVAAEIRARYNRDAIAIPPADPQLLARQHATHSAQVDDERYLLHVGTLHPRKNLAALVRIWIDWARQSGSAAVPRLVLVGRRHPQDGELFAALAEANAVPHLRTRIELRHDADDAEVAALYAGCRFLLLPSLAEGWGLPVREALCAGRPAIASAAVPAAVGSPFCRIVATGDDLALAAAIREWWDSDEPERLAGRIAAEFVPRAWGDAAREIREQLEAAR